MTSEDGASGAVVVLVRNADKPSHCCCGEFPHKDDGISRKCSICPAWYHPGHEDDEGTGMCLACQRERKQIRQQTGRTIVKAVGNQRLCIAPQSSPDPLLAWGRQYFGS